MAGRRTNLALLVALALAMGTGVAAFALGTGVGGAVVIAHGAAGFAAVLLTPWKQRIVRRGLRRPRPGRGAALALLLLVAVTVASGLAHAAGLTGLAVGVTTMQVHVGAAVLTTVAMVWHVVRRPVRPRPADVGRRSLLRAGALSVASLGAWTAAEGAYVLGGAPGAGRRFTGSHERGSGAPEQMPVTQWLFDTVPAIAGGDWRLTIDRPSGTDLLTLSDLRALPQRAARAVLDCTGGWYAEQVWHGVDLRELLGAAPGRRIVVTSVTGYRRAFPLAHADRLLLALDVAGRPLSAGHGAPARLVAPGRRGFWWVKWVARVAVDDALPWAQAPFPAQ